MSKFKTETRKEGRLNIEARNLTFPDLCATRHFYKEKEKSHVSSDQFHVLWEMLLLFLQTEQCLNILLTVSTAEKMDHNSLWGFIYFSFGDSLLFHCLFSPSAVPRINKYKLEVTADGDASSTCLGGTSVWYSIPCHQQSVTCHSTV